MLSGKGRRLFITPNGRKRKTPGKKRLKELFESSIVVQRDKYLKEYSESYPGMEEHLNKLLKHLDILSLEDIPRTDPTKPYPSPWQDMLSNVGNDDSATSNIGFRNNMEISLETLRINRGNLRQLITILVHVVDNGWASFPKRLYIDFEEVKPTTWGKIWTDEICRVEYFVKNHKSHMHFDWADFRVVNERLRCENDEELAAIKKLRVVIAILFSLETFPNVEEIAFDKRVLRFLRTSRSSHLMQSHPWL
ncbi:hypothetical protein CNYM01_00669 [Colletotrichum nymphaeae SA-01]|uniref:Uncharacterized protein n=1 Tax=Colletotrichum nymphaeae SA-01 TaxID=1460502 RepID=A0A135TEI9_9PEZI|nr:hypothetical protein CNYM01_00669 [Colletotrichum nymphaeae SA-01]